MASFKPKILFYDVETRPMVAEVWGLRDQNVSLNQVREFGGVFCFAAKWNGEKQIHFHADWKDGHEEMLKAMRDLWGQADAVCGYNHIRFDNKKMRGEFVRHGIEPPPPVADIDLFTTVSREFSFDSSKLDHVAGLLGLGNKIKHEGHELWSKVLAGDEKAQKRMERYNRQDVKLTEALYHKIRPFIKNHPHLGAGNSEACPACGSLSYIKQGPRYTRCFQIQRLQCKNCGHWYSGKSKKRMVRDVG